MARTGRTRECHPLQDSRAKLAERARREGWRFPERRILLFELRTALSNNRRRSSLQYENPAATRGLETTLHRK